MRVTDATALCLLSGLLSALPAQDQVATPTPSKATSQSKPTKSTPTSDPVPRNEAIDYPNFVKLAQELEQLREKRRVPLKQFMEMAKDPNTIILDTRSKWAFDVVHFAGAVHLNFSDFTEPKLKKVIPSKKTRILIYCNNNFTPSLTVFRDPQTLITTRSGTVILDPAGNVPPDDLEEEIIQTGAAAPKISRLALNIPTFINLHGYGYENVYELADQLPISDPRLPLKGSAVKRNRSQSTLVKSKANK